MEVTVQFIGGIAFGGVVGWITYFILRRAQPKAISDLSTIIGILGGATIVGLFNPTGATFAGYAIGLAGGFFGFFVMYLKMVGKENLANALKVELGGDATPGPLPMGGERKDNG